MVVRHGGAAWWCSMVVRHVVRCWMRALRSVGQQYCGGSVTRRLHAALSACRALTWQTEEEEPYGGFGREAEPRRKKNAEKVTYLTAHGREVKDGGGIAPDVVVAARPVRDLERALLQQGTRPLVRQAWWVWHVCGMGSGRHSVQRDAPSYALHPHVARCFYYVGTLIRQATSTSLPRTGFRLTRARRRLRRSCWRRAATRCIEISCATFVGSSI
jgi:hypothetical protein